MRTLRCAALAAAALAVPIVVLAGPKFVHTWKAPEAAGTSFAGKKVAALVIDGDDSLRISCEEALTRELAKIGLTQTVAAYRVVPKEELRSADQARVWMERGGVEGVVALRLVDKRKHTTYTPYIWTTPYYGSLWGYYDYGWGSLYEPGYVTTETILTVETLVFSVPANKLLWAGVTETKNPKGAQTLIEDLVEATVKEMTKQGIIRARAR
jgi:hypothetical protein